VHRGSVKRVASAVGEGAAAIPLIHRFLARATAATPSPPQTGNPLMASTPGTGTHPAAPATG